MTDTRQTQKPRLQIDPQQFAQEVANEIAADLRKNGGQTPAETRLEQPEE